MGQDATALAGARSAAQLFRSAGLGEARRKAELLAASVAERVSGNQRGIRDSTELTDRERAIALAAAQRERSREIAARLGLSVRTVDNHLRNIYRKLGVASRDELGRELGLESVP
jgi:DNA-binding CsgD family transcriptional regulator